MTRRKMRRFAEGGDTYQTARRARKEADIESDYQKALKAGKNAQIALAKKEQRMADAADDFAKWTRADRTQTRAAERAAESALSEARRTQGRSIADRDLGSRINPAPTEPIKTPKIEAPDLSGYFKAPTSSKAAAPRRAPATQAPARREEAPKSSGAWYGRPTAPAPSSASSSPATPAAPPARPPAPESNTRAPSLFIGTRAAREQEANAPTRAGLDISGALEKFGRRNEAGRAYQSMLRAKEAAARAREAADRVRESRTPSSMPLSKWPQASLSQFAPEDDEPDYPLRAKRKGGTVKKTKKPVKKSCGGGMAKGYAKGGSIDGCAIRGKTRAKRTK